MKYRQKTEKLGLPKQCVWLNSGRILFILCFRVVSRFSRAIVGMDFGSERWNPASGRVGWLHSPKTRPEAAFHPIQLHRYGLECREFAAAFVVGIASGMRSI